MGVVIAPSFTSPVQPFHHPRVAWRRRFGNFSASTEAEGFDAENALNERTDTFWKPTALPATFSIIFAPNPIISYCGIAAHTLGSSGCTVFVEQFVAGLFGWETVAEITPTNDDPLLFLFSKINRSEMRVRITGGATMPLVGVLWMGDVTEWPRPAVYAPSVSFQRAKRSEFSANVTEGGQIVGRKLIRREIRPQMAVEYLSESWIETEFDAFAEHAETLPFFVADRPADYPDSVAYAFADADLVPERAYPKASIANSVTLEMRAYRAK